MDLLWLAIIIAILSIIIVFVINSFGIWYFMSPKERSILAAVITLLGISLSQLSIVIIPMDVYNASFSSPDTYEIMNMILQVSYYFIFVSVIILSSVFIPFAYFYTEACYIEDEDVTEKKKILSALKYTVVPIVVVSILLIIGLFLHTNHISTLIANLETDNTEKQINSFVKLLNNYTSQYESSDDSSYYYTSGESSSSIITYESYDATSEVSSNEIIVVDANTAEAYNYLEDLLDSNVLVYSISFAYFIITGMGFILFWLTYTAFGMSAVAVLFIKGTKRVEEESRDIQKEIEENKEIVEKLEKRYSSKMPDKKRKQYDDAQYKIEQLEAQLQYLDDATNPSLLNRLKSLSKPAWFLLGVIMMVMSAVVILSLLFTLLIRLRDSDCGWSCGYVITSPQTILNPLDFVLTYSSQYFPIDVVIFVSIVVFIITATMGGIFTIGIRFLWIKMFSVRPRKTIPQAMVFAALIIMLCSLCLMIEILSIAPQYSTFGSRSYINENGDSIWCNMSAGPDACPMTQIAQIINRFFASLNLAGIAFYIGSIAFIVMFLLGIGVSVWMSKKSNVSHIEEEDIDEDF